MATRKARRRPLVTGGSYKKGARLRIKPHGPSTVSPGVVTSPHELAEQYRIMQALKVETAKQLRVAQALVRKWERRDTLLTLARSIDEAVVALETSLGALQSMVAKFAIFSANSRAAILVEDQKFND